MNPLKPINIIYEVGIFLLYLYIGINHLINLPFDSLLIIIFFILVTSITIRAYKKSWQCLLVSSFSFGFLAGTIIWSLFIYSEGFQGIPLVVKMQCLGAILLIGVIGGIIASIWSFLLKYFIESKKNWKMEDRR